MKTTRRDFLKRSAAVGAVASVPYIWTSRYARAADANSTLAIAAIGVGGSRGRYNQGGNDASAAARYGKMIAVCDVDDRHAGEFNQRFNGQLNTYRDYRVMFEKEKPDIVTIGTPDHWHVPIAIAALRAGCDVYCEKPLTLTLEEGPIIRKVVEETGRVFQVGTQQRSQDNLWFLQAIALVQTGRLGKNVKAYLAIGGAPSGGPFQPTEAPDDLDWDMWLGPTPRVDYINERRLMFRWWFEYSGGKMTDWGAHHIDIAQWALGLDKTGPVKVRGVGTFPTIPSASGTEPVVPDDFDWDAYLDGKIMLPNAYNTPTQFSVDLEFADGTVINVNHDFNRESDNTSFDNGILFEGDEGRIFVNRERLTGTPIEQLDDAGREEIAQKVTELYKGKEPGNHMRNFFECVEDHSEPISGVVTHVRTMESCHLCNIALMLGRELTWNPDKEEFVGDDQAAALMSRVRRESYTLDV